MQTVQIGIVKTHIPQTQPTVEPNNVGAWLAKVFGCWHREMSRPFSRQGKAYRSCLHCGAQRQFNLGNWEMQGDYYFPVESRASFRRANLKVVPENNN